MTFAEIQAIALRIRDLYGQLNQTNGQNSWSAAEYLQGLVGDLGELAKLVMAKNNFRQIEDLDAKLHHELADCLWSLYCIADTLGINLEQAFVQTMSEIERKLLG